MRNPKISKKAAQRVWKKVLKPAITAPFKEGISTARELAQDLAAQADRAAALITPAVDSLTQFVHAARRRFRTNDVLEATYNMHQRRWEAMAAPLRDSQILQGGYHIIGQWKLTQMQRLAQGQSMKEFAGMPVLQSICDAMTLFEVPARTASATQSPRIVSFPSQVTLAGAIHDGQKIPVWKIQALAGANFPYHYDYLRTALVTRWDVTRNEGQPELGILESISRRKIVGTTMDMWILSATVKGRIIPIPTPLRDDGAPLVYYESDKGWVAWSSKAGQFFLVRDTDEVEAIDVLAYSTEEDNPLRLFRDQAAPETIKTSTRPEDLSTYTRDLFDSANRLGDRTRLGPYALTEREQLHYIAFSLSQSWQYELAPRNLEAFQQAGKPILQNLHDVMGINTANCGLANMEFAEAARVFGYTTQLVSGFLFTSGTSIDAPGHLWTEAYVDGRWEKMDVTPRAFSPVTATWDVSAERLMQVLAISYSPIESIVQRLSDPSLQMSPSEMLQLGKDMLAGPGAISPPPDTSTWVAGVDQLYRWTETSASTVRVEVFRHRFDRIAVPGEALGDFEIYTASSFFTDKDWQDVHDTLRNAGGNIDIDFLLQQLREDNGSTLHLRPGTYKDPVMDPSPHGFQAQGALQRAVQRSKAAELRGDYVDNAPGHVVIPAVSARPMTVCNNLRDVHREFKLPSGVPEDVILNLLASLQFETVLVETTDDFGLPTTKRFALSRKAELLLSWDGLSGAHFKTKAIRFSPLGKRLLMVPAETLITNDRPENMAVKFAAMLFEREKGGPVPYSDRQLLKTAHQLLRRYPPHINTSGMVPMILSAYVIEEARRHDLSGQELVTITGLPSSGTVACDISEGCELKPAVGVASQQTPQVADDEILVAIARSVESLKRFQRYYSLVTIDPRMRTWFDGFLARHFTKVTKN